LVQTFLYQGSHEDVFTHFLFTVTAEQSIFKSHSTRHGRIYCVDIDSRKTNTILVQNVFHYSMTRFYERFKILKIQREKKTKMYSN